MTYFVSNNINLVLVPTCPNQLFFHTAVSFESRGTFWAIVRDLSARVKYKHGSSELSIAFNVIQLDNNVPFHHTGLTHSAPQGPIDFVKCDIDLLWDESAESSFCTSGEAEIRLQCVIGGSI